MCTGMPKNRLLHPLLWYFFWAFRQEDVNVLQAELKFIKNRSIEEAHPHMDSVISANPLSANTCDLITHIAQYFPTSVPRTVGDDQYPNRRQACVRMIEQNEKAQFLFNLLYTAARSATKDHFNLDINGMSRCPQYVEYTPKQSKFGWHNDYSHGGPDAPWKITVIIQLSDPAEYRGGTLQVFGIEIENLPKERGSILAFPSTNYHQVAPVIWGMRKTLVALISGPRPI
jgi:PKHD-type hydroxylase